MECLQGKQDWQCTGSLIAEAKSGTLLWHEGKKKRQEDCKATTCSKLMRHACDHTPWVRSKFKNAACPTQNGSGAFRKAPSPVQTRWI